MEPMLAQGGLQHHARLRPDKIALVCSGQRLTYAQIDAMAIAWATPCKRMGLRPATGSAFICTTGREEGIHILEVTGFWLNRLGLPQVAAPCHRTLSSWAYYYKANDKQLSETLRDPNVWAPTSFDGDASL